AHSAVDIADGESATGRMDLEVKPLRHLYLKVKAGGMVTLAAYVTGCDTYSVSGRVDVYRAILPISSAAGSLYRNDILRPAGDFDAAARLQIQGQLLTRRGSQLFFNGLALRHK